MIIYMYTILYTYIYNDIYNYNYVYIYTIHILYGYLCFFWFAHGHTSKVGTRKLIRDELVPPMVKRIVPVSPENAAGEVPSGVMNKSMGSWDVPCKKFGKYGKIHGSFPRRHGGVGKIIELNGFSIFQQATCDYQKAYHLIPFLIFWTCDQTE